MEPARFFQFLGLCTIPGKQREVNPAERKAESASRSRLQALEIKHRRAENFLLMKKAIAPVLELDWKIAVLTVSSTLLLLVDFYHPDLIPWGGISLFGKTITPGWLNVPPTYLDGLLLYLAVPLAITLLIFRENPREYGFTLGKWRLGLALTAGSILAIAPVLWLVTRSNTTMQNYYRGQASGLPWNMFVDLFGWEFFFRGWLIFGYGRRFGAEALWLQAVPFALAHIGKPEIETLSTIFGGFAFGWVAWKTKSFFWPFLIHWFVASFTILVAAGAFG
jgi:membrane protease YdiL (CAAX protease family)